MSLRILESDGCVSFELKYGTLPTPKQLEETLDCCMYAEASGMELDECRRILGRNVSAGRNSGGFYHRFSADATEEIILNWSR
jgi:hypothetical protein